MMIASNNGKKINQPGKKLGGGHFFLKSNIILFLINILMLMRHGMKTTELCGSFIRSEGADSNIGSAINNNNNVVNNDEEPSTSKSGMMREESKGELVGNRMINAYKIYNDGDVNFLKLGLKRGTDKVAANDQLESCLKNGHCTREGCKNEACRPWGHFYNTLYQQRLGEYSNPRLHSEKFQFLEIGFYNGAGYDTYVNFLVPTADVHSMEISCIEQGPRAEGKWPFGNFAEKNKNYKKYLESNKLHCGDANDITFLNTTWTEKMYSPDKPLKIVIDDGAHVSAQMVQTVFFWFPRIEPRGFLIVEDIQPIPEANTFRTQFLPQIMFDLHYCGQPKGVEEEGPCFPTLQPLLASIHCEMHICIFERNDMPSYPNFDLNQSKSPPNALDRNKCPAFHNH